MSPSPTGCAAQTLSVEVDGLLGFIALRLIYFLHVPHRFVHVCLRVPRGDYRIMGPGGVGNLNSRL